MTIPSHFEPDFRPESYWDHPAALHANIKGEWRRRKLESADGDELANTSPFMFAESLKGSMRRLAGSLHPMLVCGEYLPDYLPGEIEIARVAQASTTCDVTSIRARPEGNLIHYQVVCEDEEWEVYPPTTSSSAPLSFAELVEFIDNTETEGEYLGLVWCCWLEQYFQGSEPEEAAAFATPSSVFYPQLEAYYEEEAKRWIREIEDDDNQQ